MMQVGKQTGTNDKNRKDQYTKIKKIQKSSSWSPHNNKSVGDPSSMNQNKLHRTNHDPKIAPMTKKIIQ